MSSTDSNTQHIRTLSQLLAAMCLLLIVTLPIAVVGYWFVADAAELATHAHLSGSAIQTPLHTWQRVTGAIITLVPLALLLQGLWQARKCFKLFCAGQVFTTRCVGLLRRFAGWVAASVAAAIITRTALSVVLTLHNPPGAQHLAIGIGSDQLFTLFFAGMVWLMAAVISQGQSLAEENANFV